ncbi:glycerol kinase [Chloroflexota bacterium]
MSDNQDCRKELSTTALAKAMGKSPQVIFQQLHDRGLIVKNADSWDLIDKGKSKGGYYKKSHKHGRYIVWPEELKYELNTSQKPRRETLLTATAIGKHFEISPNKTNYILSELGWVKKGLKGWLITDSGKRLNGSQSKDKTSGIPYVRWPESIVSNRALIASIHEVKGTAPVSLELVHSNETAEIEFRKKFEAKYRATDGHYVRSKAEQLIDNWLYMSEVVHAYERKLPIEEEAYCDFYIPTGKVYIEYWGYDANTKYQARKEKKLEIYKKYGFGLIQLIEEDVQNLDDRLPKFLLEFGVKTD